MTTCFNKQSDMMCMLIAKSGESVVNPSSQEEEAVLNYGASQVGGFNDLAVRIKQDDRGYYAQYREPFLKRLWLGAGDERYATQTEALAAIGEALQDTLRCWADELQDAQEWASDVISDPERALLEYKRAEANAASHRRRLAEEAARIS